jgi:hypothetical protein
MPVEVGDGEREPVVDADDGRGVRREFLAEPFGETPSCLVPLWAGWGLNLSRRAGAPGDVDPEFLATGVGRFRAEGSRAGRCRCRCRWCRTSGRQTCHPACLLLGRLKAYTMTYGHYINGHSAGYVGQNS